MTVQHRNETTQGGFTQTPNVILKDARITAQARLLYSLLKSYAWQKDNTFPGQKRLAEELGVSDRRVRIYINELVDCGLVTVQRRGNKETNMYWLEDAVRSDWKKTTAHSTESDRKNTSGHEWKKTTAHSTESDRKNTSDKEDPVLRRLSTRQRERAPLCLKLNPNQVQTRQGQKNFISS